MLREVAFLHRSAFRSGLTVWRVRRAASLLEESAMPSRDYHEVRKKLVRVLGGRDGFCSRHRSAVPLSGGVNPLASDSTGDRWLAVASGEPA